MNRVKKKTLKNKGLCPLFVVFSLPCVLACCLFLDFCLINLHILIMIILPWLFTSLCSTVMLLSICWYKTCYHGIWKSTNCTNDIFLTASYICLCLMIKMVHMSMCCLRVNVMFLSMVHSVSVSDCCFASLCLERERERERGSETERERQRDRKF